MSNTGKLIIGVLCLGISASSASAQLRLAPPEDSRGPAAGPPSGGGGPRGSAGTYQRDDGEIDTSLGGITGELCWIHAFATQGGSARITSVSTGWSNYLSSGMPGRIFIWEDPNDDGIPNDAILLHQEAVTVQNPCPQYPAVCSVVEYTLSTPVTVTGGFFVGASAQMSSTTYPAPIDRDSGEPLGQVWYDFDTGTFDPNSLANASDFNVNFASGGVWLLRARGTAIDVGYQGHLALNGTPVDGVADVEFTLFDASSGGAQIGAPAVVSGVAVTDGLFSVAVPFEGALFDGGPRYFAVRVAYPAGGSFAALSPRQPVAAAPYAQRALAVSWSCIDDIPAGFADGTDDAGSTLDASDGSPTGVVSVDADGRVLVSGPIRTAGSGTLLYCATNDVGNPSGDGLRLRLDPSFFVGSAEAFVFEKTDSSAAPDGGIAFVNTGSDGIVDTAMVIRGDGRIGIGLNAPTAKLHIGGTAGTDGLRFPDGTLQTTAFPGGTVGDITGVTAGTGLTGGGTSGNVTLNVDFAGSGAASTVARSDHAHSSLDAADGSPVQVVAVDAAGQVGIGTSSPGATLTVQGPADTGDIWIRPTNAGGNSDIKMTENVSGASGMLLRYNGLSNLLEIIGLQSGAENPAPTISVGRGTSSGVDIANSLTVGGNIGVGTTAPATILHLAKADSPTIRIQDNGTTPVTYHIGVATSDNTLRIAETGVADRILITQTTGLVGIARNPTANRLEVEGNASKTAAGSWLANSDRRIKTDVTTISSALETLDKLRMVRFRYTEQYRAAHPAIEDREYLNVIAQEFAQAFPEWVQSSGEKLPDGSDILQVDTYPITIYTAAAVQELHRKLAERDARISALEERLQRIENSLAAQPSAFGTRR
jgi:hypothetical protein